MGQVWPDRLALTVTYGDQSIRVASTAGWLDIWATIGSGGRRLRPRLWPRPEGLRRGRSELRAAFFGRYSVHRTAWRPGLRGIDHKAA